MHSLEASFLSLTAVHCPWTTLGLSRSEKTVLCNFSWTRPPSGREETWGGVICAVENEGKAHCRVRFWGCFPGRMGRAGYRKLDLLGRGKTVLSAAC